MDKKELIFQTMDDLIRYLNECGEDEQIHIEIEIGTERRSPDGKEERDTRPVFHG